MSLGSALNSALSGISVSQQQINTISNNVSNATNEGFTRKILPQSAQVAGNDVIGAQTETLVRNVDINLQRDIWSQTAKVAELDTKKSFLKPIQDFHGAPDEKKSISAEMSKLRDSFSQLSDSPSDSFLQSKVVEQAQTVTRRINDFANIVKDMRNNAESEITTSVNTLNDKLQRVANLNQQIKQNIAIDKSVADLKDKRDGAVKAIANEVEISTFERGDGALVVQTAKGVKLADETAKDIFFEESNLGPNTFYPDGGANGLFVGGDPEENKTAIDIADDNLGGRIGAALEIRDTIGPRYQAQIDELAHKTALRFEDQGLRLFTGDAGTIPPDDPPDTTTTPQTPVKYVGFANNIQINDAVLNDNSLVQKGTFQPDEAIQAGSTEAIDRIIEFAFGDTKVQRADGQIDLQVAVSDKQLEGVDLINDPDSPITTTPPSTPQEFEIKLDLDRDGSFTGPPNDETLTIDFNNPTASVGGQINNLDELVTEINQLSNSSLPQNSDFQAGKTEDGRLKIDSVFDIQFTDNMNTPAPGSGEDNIFDFLGISKNTTLKNNELQNRLGLLSQNEVKSTVDLSQFDQIDGGAPDDIATAFDNILDIGSGSAANDSFTINVSNRADNASKSLTIDLSAIATDSDFNVGTMDPSSVLDGGMIDDAADQIASYINQQFSSSMPNTAVPPPDTNFQAKVNDSGEIVFTSRGDIEIDAGGGSNPIGDPAFEALFGIEAKNYEAEDPNFEIQIGNNKPQKIAIAPGDKTSDLLDKINFGGPTTGVPGAYADVGANGQIIMRPGTDDSTGDDRVFGGELKITSGPFQNDPASATQTKLSGTSGSVNVVSALFGSFNDTGTQVNQASPINNVEFSSEVSQSGNDTVGFRKRLLGPDLSVKTEIGSTNSITRFAERLVNRQSSDFAETDNTLGNEENFKKTLEKQFTDQFGVNIDEELSRLIVQQNAFSASSRAISTINQLFDELLNAVR